MILNLIFILFTLTIGILLVRNAGQRLALDVIEDLKPDGKSVLGELHKSKKTDQQAIREFYNMGLFDKKSINAFMLRQKLTAVSIIALMLTIKLIFFKSDTASLIVTLIMSVSFAVIVNARIKVNLKNSYRERIEFFLPIVMERIVMAVQSGLDIVPAIMRITSLEEVPSGGEARTSTIKNGDPVNHLMKLVVKLIENGLTVEKSLFEVSGFIECSSLKHAFIHLALAYKEGGELIAPLKELSDSTQLYFQESIEEQIAKMPVKATMPLLLTFAGLIICFITSPIIQIMGLTTKAMPQ